MQTDIWLKQFLMWFAGLWITMRGVWQQKLDGKTAVLRLPTSTNEKKSFFLTESEIEPHGCWMDLVRSSKVAGRRLLSHLKGGTWNCLHTYRDKVIRQLLEQCWLPCILIYSLANLDFSSIPGEVGTSQASDMTVLLISTFCSGLPWLYFSFQLYWDMTDIQHCVSFKAWEVMWWNTTYYKMITSITLANTLSCHIITFFFFWWDHLNSTVLASIWHRARVITMQGIGSWEFIHLLTAPNSSIPDPL